MSDQEPAGAVQPRVGRVRRPEIVACGWCDAPVPVPTYGRIPKWCKDTGCRHRAWEQSRAAASGLSAREVVERIIEKPVTHVIREPLPVPVQTPAARPPPLSPAEWAATLREFADRLDSGRFYPRDWPALETAITELNAAADRARHYGIGKNRR